MRRQSVAELMFYTANTHRPTPPQRYFNPSLSSTERHGNRSEQQQQPSWSLEAAESFSRRSHELRNSTLLQTKTRPIDRPSVCLVRSDTDMMYMSKPIPPPATFPQLIGEKMTNTFAGATLSRLCLPACLSMQHLHTSSEGSQVCGPLEGPSPLPGRNRQELCFSSPIIQRNLL